MCPEFTLSRRELKAAKSTEANEAQYGVKEFQPWLLLFRGKKQKLNRMSQLKSFLHFVTVESCLRQNCF